MDGKTEIRKVSPGHLFALVQTLECDESWKKLMAVIPNNLTLDNFECKITINNLPKYNTDHFKLIEHAGNKLKKPCSEILFEEWGTSGRIRPRLGHLLRLLVKAELFRAADYVALDLLHITAPQRPETGPAAQIDITLHDSEITTNTFNNNNIERILDEIDYPSSIINSNFSNQIDNINQNLQPIKRIIPKIIVNDDSSSNNEIQQNFPVPSNRFSHNNRPNNGSSGSSNASLSQLERKLERLTCTSQIPENKTESTSIDSNSSSSISDMIQFSSPHNHIPDLDDLLLNENYSSLNNSFEVVSPEARNYILPQLSELIRSEQISSNEINNLPQLSELIQSGQISVKDIPDFNVLIQNSIFKANSSDILPAFSQILSTEENIVPAFSQILSSQNNIPIFSSLLSDHQEPKNLQSNDEIFEIPHINIESQPIPNFDLLQSTEKTQSSEIVVTRKISISPVNTSRTTCASPLPNLSLNTVLPHFTYYELEQCTQNFDEEMLSSHHSTYENEPKGRKLGSGAFGSVYLGLKLLSRPVAVKKLNLNGVNVVNVDDTVTKQFRNEVELLCKYKHENLLSLLGYSCDGPTYCLIYEYISGGALKDRLQTAENRIIWTNRLYIALGTAKAVSYLHNAYSMPLIHRDIKSANILLDNSDKPKLCDFGLIKLTPNQNTNTSTTVFGTSAYMAPEAFRGDVSVKLDTFSFGVVLLELLTGLPPLDENREGNDLITHIEDVCEDDIKPLLDSKAGSWTSKDTNFGEQLYLIAMQCLEEKKKRPIMTEVVKQLSQLIDKTI